jgi:UDP-N-acetylmuramoylalanine--D-glutamate ligase
MYENKIIGIWGLGKVGNAAAHFFSRKKAQVIGMDTHALQEIGYCSELVTEERKQYFFQTADYLLASPGVDIRPYHAQYATKWITELDIFASQWQKPVIAITGSVGKTTITHILSQLLEHYATKVAVGGNIGTPMLELIDQEADIALLEVSSFQLEHCTSFAPDVALWTNFAPNHLDRHTLEEYFNAKTHIFAFQKEQQQAIIPYSIFQQLRIMYPNKIFTIIADTSPVVKAEQESLINQGHTIFCVDGTLLCKYTSQGKAILLDIAMLPTSTFTSNWIALCAVLDSLGYEVGLIPTYAAHATIPEHRMEKIVRENIVFYNDSKATTPLSTLSAVDRLVGQDIILFLGGLSKGVDRSTLIRDLQSKVKRVYCFGAEASLLHHWCAYYEIPSSAHTTLDDAFLSCMNVSQVHHSILFSPSGSSFDLFKNYQERGTHFKQLITNHFQGK